MSFLEDLGGERPDRPTPERVFALVDHDASQDVAGLMLDAVEADWFESEAPRGAWVETAAPEDVAWRVSALELGPRASGEVREISGGKTWLELQLSPPRPSDDVNHFINLYAAPDQQELIWARSVPYTLEDQLNEAHSLAPLGAATEEELVGVLGGATSWDAAAVYDVGQGGCNALIDSDAPVLYFDFGGGCLWNAKTYPAALKEFCFCADPVVVLSHWDRDHWAAAPKDKRVLSSPWIVPDQGVLPSTHLAFLISLVKANTPHKVHVWPTTLRDVTVGPVTIERAQGAGRNDSGLALVARGPKDDEQMLFPADAAYDHIASAPGIFTSLVASHHGGRTGATFVPRSDKAGHGRLVYSYGDPNRYGHPKAAEVADHGLLWKQDLRTPALRKQLGHVHLYWDQNQADVTLRCNGANCQLGRCQR